MIKLGGGKLTSSWLVAWWAGAVLCGVILAQHDPVYNSYIWLVLAVLGAIISLFFRHVFLIALVIPAGLLLGLWRGSVEMEQLALYEFIAGHEVTITGRVLEDTDTLDERNISMRLGDVRYDGYKMPGYVWVSAPEGYDIKRSDHVTVHGNLGDGFGGFSGSMFRAEVLRIERPVPGDMALHWRDWFATVVRNSIPEPQASLGLGYLLGQRRALPPELDDSLRIAGLTHAIVASGYNLTILVRLSRRLFMRVSKYAALLAASSMVVGFIAVTGMSPSMARAGLVTGLSLLAWWYGRNFHPLVLLPFVAAITVLINPHYAWGDVGWQLSFAAFAGVMILAPLAQRYFYGEKEPGNIRQILGETISAQIVTLPILILTFGYFSNVAVLANLLVLPLVPLAMLLVFLVGIATFITPWLAELIGFPTTMLLTYMTDIASYLASRDWAIMDFKELGFEFTLWHAVGMYILLIGVCIYMQRKTGFSLSSVNITK